jgi:hypothetical protein
LGELKRRIEPCQEEQFNLILSKRWSLNPLYEVKDSNVLYMELKKVLVLMVRLMPHQEYLLFKNVDAFVQLASESNDFLLVQHGILAKELLEKVNVLFIEEIALELHERNIKEEKERLSNIYQSLQSQQMSLQSQLESYKLYLDNIKHQKTITLTLAQLKKDGILLDSNFYTDKKVTVTMNRPFTGLIAMRLCFKGNGWHE